jgi:hypothetical protein
LQEPLDKKVFGSSFSDVALVGKLFTHMTGRHQSDWWKIGMIIHIFNGAAVGCVIPLFARKFAVSNLSSALLIIGT